MKQFIDGNTCIDCKLCMQGCLLLDDFTESPKALLEKTYTFNEDISFSCATCGYCESVCPKDISFEAHFSEAKTQHAKSDKTLMKYGYKSVMFHQKYSFSNHFTAIKKFTEGTHTDVAFMPGCALSSYSPKLVQQVYEHLHSKMPGIGLLQQCCGQPTKAVGDMKRFHTYYQNLEADVRRLEATTIITACENCYMNLKEFSPHIQTRSLYDVLAEVGIPKTKDYSQETPVAFHDPCPTRHESSLHVSTRKLMDEIGLSYVEFKDNRDKTQCCGSGGMLELTNPKLALKQMQNRCDQTTCETIVSYCQSCAQSMSRGGKNGVHLLDLIFGDKVAKTMQQPKMNTFKAWVNRYRSKRLIEKR